MAKTCSTLTLLVFGLSGLLGCGRADHPPPPASSFGGLPVSGSLSDAHRAGFTNCLLGNTDIRCRRNRVTFLGFGPPNAAVDLDGSDGGGGFDHLTLWHDRDQNAAIAIAESLERHGWQPCYTGEGNKGDQAIYRQPGSPVLISVDLSYWGKRRLRVIPEWNNRERRC